MPNPNPGFTPSLPPMDSTTGKSFFIYSLLILIFHLSSTHSDSTSTSDPTQIINVLTHHISQLTKLDELVKNLTELVTKLESHVPESLMNSNNNRNSVSDTIEINNQGTDNTDRVGAISVTKHSLLWSERFQFVSALKLDTQATSLNILPFKDIEGLSKYVAVGDEVGNLYVFTRYGDIMLRFDTRTRSPITSMLSYLSVYRNETVVVTGHGNGVVLVHKVWEIPNGDDSSLLERESVYKHDVELGCRINILEVHHVGRTRYIVSVDGDGRITVFKEGGSVLSKIGTIVTGNRPLVFSKQKLLFLSGTGVGSLDLRNMKVREAPCEGLNGSYALNYVFDALDRGKAYGFTSGGELVHLLVYGDAVNFKCRVRSKKKFDVGHGSLAFEAIKGYFLISSREKVFVYNVSSQLYVRAGLPRLVFSAGLDEIIGSFLNYRAMGWLDGKKVEPIPLIASDHEKMVVLSLESGYIGMYRSNLPVTKGEFNTMLWSTPVLFFVLFLFVAWHFFKNKKDVLMSWGPYDAYGSGAPTPSGPGPRSFSAPISRKHDGGGNNSGVGGGIRGPPRRYGSPTRYTGSGANVFRQSAIDPNPRSGPPDPDFRGSELKYRGSGIEPSGFGQRREGLFGSSRVVDDSGS